MPTAEMTERATAASSQKKKAFDRILISILRRRDELQILRSRDGKSG